MNVVETIEVDRPKGGVAIIGARDANGCPIELQKLLADGIVNRVGVTRYGARYALRVANGEIDLGENLFVDTGRQAVCFAFGERSPTTNFTVQKFGLGVGTTPPAVTDTSLSEPLTFYAGLTLKPVDNIAYPAPFVMQVQFTMGLSEANGHLITEMGLFTSNGTLIARRTHTGINKKSDVELILAWRFRF